MPEDPENRDFSIEKSVDKAGVRRAYVDIFNWKKVMKSSDSSDSSAKRSKSLPAFKLFLSQNSFKAGKDLYHFMRLFGHPLFLGILVKHVLIASLENQHFRVISGL